MKLDEALRDAAVDLRRTPIEVRSGGGPPCRRRRVVPAAAVGLVVLFAGGAMAARSLLDSQSEVVADAGTGAAEIAEDRGEAGTISVEVDEAAPETPVSVDRGGAGTSSVEVDEAAPETPVAAVQGLLPQAWSNQDIGDVGLEGSVSGSEGTFTLRGAGLDISWVNDGFHYMYQPLVGDGEISARVVSVDSVHPFTKAGVMVRETLNESSPHGMVNVRSDGGVFSTTRLQEAARTGFERGGEVLATPYWVRLVRTADTFDAYQSVDGKDWVLFDTQTIVMDATVYIGLAVTSHDTSILASATFDSVTVRQQGQDDESNGDPCREILSGMTGFAKAAGTTGGAGGQVVWVTNLNDSGAGSLREALTAEGKRCIRFQMSGTIDLKTRVLVMSDKTIDGRGQDVTISGERLWLSGVSNIVVHNIKMVGMRDDAITINDSNRVWLDHITFQDTGDELVSGAHGSTDVTISWNKFQTPESGHYAILWSNGRDSDATQDRNARVTIHHNFFDSVDERGPRVSYGVFHVYNNYSYDWTRYAVVSSQESELYSEGNIYEMGPNSQKPYAIRAIAHGQPKTGYAVSNGDLFQNGAVTEGEVVKGEASATVFDGRTPDSFYSYTAEEATDALTARIESGAGWQNTSSNP